jgi:hypothetical protein
MWSLYAETSGALSLQAERSACAVAQSAGPKVRAASYQSMELN